MRRTLSGEFQNISRGQDVLHAIDTMEKAVFFEIAGSLRETAVF